jgi:HlyD family secretion protein
MRRFALIVGCLITIAACGTSSARGDDASGKPAASAASPSDKAGEKAKHKVTRAPFQIEISLDGVFEAREKEEIALSPDSWAELTVREVVPQGKAVAAGDLLLRLDAKHLEDAISDLEAVKKIGALSISQAEADLALQEKTAPLDMQAAEQSKRAADEDVKHFLEEDREMKTKTADFTLKEMQERLEYVTSELKQLEKMYRGGDLREETEEIILKRQRNAVENARFMLEQMKANHDRTIGTSLPREEEKLRESAQRAAAALEKLQHSQPAAITKARLELEKLRTENARSHEKLEKLRHDLELMKLQAPRSGVIYYGAYRLGQWATGAAVAAKLVPGGTVQAHEVLMTVVDPKSLEIRAAVPEAEMHLLDHGLKGTATPTAFPGERIAATVADVPQYPDVAGKYIVRLTLDDGRLAKLNRLPAPGMTCKVTLLVYKADTVTVPAKAVFADPAADSAEYVFAEVDGKPQRREVKTGRRGNDRIEITDGLKPGDTVLLDRPEGM